MMNKSECVSNFVFGRVLPIRMRICFRFLFQFLRLRSFGVDVLLNRSDFTECFCFWFGCVDTDDERGDEFYKANCSMRCATLFVFSTFIVCTHSSAYLTLQFSSDKFEYDFFCSHSSLLPFFYLLFVLSAHFNCLFCSNTKLGAFSTLPPPQYLHSYFAF